MSWKDLYELAPQMTAGEIRFEKAKRLVGLVLGPLCFLWAMLSPPLEHVTPLGMRSLAIFGWTVIWWITEAIPIPATSLMVLALLVICGVLPLEKAFGYWGHWDNLFLIGTFIIGHAMHLHGLTRRFSLSLVTSKLVGSSPWRLLVLFLIANAALSSVLSNTVTSVLFLSVGLGLLRILEIEPGSGFGMAMFLGIAWATNIGGVLTPGGTPTNLIAISLAEKAGYRIGYGQWILGNVVFTLLQMLAMFLVLRIFLRREEREFQLTHKNIGEEFGRQEPFNRGEKFALGALLTALVFWVLPDLAPLFLERAHPVAIWLNTRLNWGVVALLVAVSLFLMPLDWKARKFAMTWPEAVKSVEWGTLALVAAAIALGDLVGNKEAGLGELFAANISAIAGPQTPPYWLVLGIIAVTVMLTQLTTNIAVVGILGPVALAVAPAFNLNPIALLVLVGIASNVGYAFPMANPPCAIVFASGYVRILPMFQRGMILAILGVILLSLVGYPVVARLFPWPLPTTMAGAG